MRYSSCHSVRDVDVKSLDEGRWTSPSDNAIFSLTGRFPSQWRSVFEWSLEGEAEGSCWVMGVEGAAGVVVVEGVWSDWPGPSCPSGFHSHPCCS